MGMSLNSSEESKSATLEALTRRKFLVQSAEATLGAMAVNALASQEVLAQGRDRKMGPPIATEVANNREQKETVGNAVVLKVVGNMDESAKASLASELSADLYTHGVSNPQVLLESDSRAKTLKEAPPVLVWDCKARLIPGKSKTTKSWGKTVLKGAVSIGAGAAQTAIGGRAGGVIGDVARGEAGVNSAAGTIHYSTYRFQGGLSFGGELSSVNEEITLKAEMNNRNAWEYSLVMPNTDGKGTSDKHLFTANYYELDEARAQQVAFHYLLKYKSPSVIKSLMEDFRTASGKVDTGASIDDAGRDSGRPREKESSGNGARSADNNIPTVPLPPVKRPRQ